MASTGTVGWEMRWEGAETEVENVRRRRAQLVSSPTACIRSYCRIPSRQLKIVRGHSPSLVTVTELRVPPQREKEDRGMETG